VLSIKEREFVQAAQAMGGKPFYIILATFCRRHYMIISQLWQFRFIVAEC